MPEPGTGPWFDRTRVLPFGVRTPARYEPVRALQERLLEERIAGASPDLILVGEHARVITLGRGVKTPPEALGPQPLDVVAVERGGQATWHGPGQLVAYPIVSLGELRLGVRDYLRALEEAIVRVLAQSGLEGRRRDGATGVWVGEKKVASIGVAIRRRVTWHGLALNVAPDLADFQRIEPCGFAASVMTSMEQLLEDRDAATAPARVPYAVPSMEEMRLAMVRELVRVLHLAPPIWEPEATFGPAVTRPPA